MTPPRGLAIAALLAATAARAEDCTVLATQGAMNGCSQRNLAAADAELNRLWEALTGRLAQDPDGKAALVAAQRAWIGFRDAECTFAAAGVAGGSIYPMIFNGCLQVMTEDRTRTLGGYLGCEEGDLSCPVPPP